MKIGHLVLKVRSLEASLAFYRDLLGLRVTGERKGMAFLSGGESHHEVGLLEVGPRAPLPPPYSLGLFHLGFEVGSMEELLRLYRTLTAKGVRILSSVDHVVSRSFYVQDPDGHVVELLVDEPQGRWGALENPFAEDFPFDIEELAEKGP